MGGIEKRKRYYRIGDMHHSKALNIWVEQDGDIVLYITEGRIPIDNADVEFCEIGSGGGLSPNVRKALIELIKAIEMDNITNPDSRVVSN